MSVSGPFEAAIRDAFDRPDAEARVDAVKSAVTRRFEDTDQGVRVTHTAYFNHTVVPDIILRWPREGRERSVFLRANSDPAWLADDLPWLTKSKPIVLTLAPPGPPHSEASSAILHKAASTAQTLVTNPAALDAVDLMRPSEPMVGILAQALVQGGRGLVEKDEAATAARVTTLGFAGAQNLDEGATGSATAYLAELLDTGSAGRMTRVLQAVWEGHGGSLTAFPTQKNLGGALTEDDLAFLLETLSTDDWSFWRRIGASVTTAQLARLALPDSSPNFQSLVRASLPHLMAKALRIREDLAEDGIDGILPTWLVAHGCLALRGNGWTAYMAPNKVDELPSATEREGIAIDELRKRAAAQSVQVGHVQLRRGDHTIITYEATEAVDIVNDDELSALAVSATGLTKRVTRATVTLPAGRRLTCDFQAGSGTGHTTAVFPVAELARTGIPLLVKLSDEELTGIEIPATCSDFKIDRPSFLTVPIKNEIPVKVDMTWQKM